MSNNAKPKTVVNPNYHVAQPNHTGQYVYSKESELNFIKQNNLNKHRTAHSYNN